MTELRFPSSEFPDGPSVGLEVPAGWQPVTVPGAALAVIRPEPDDVFNPNVVVTVEPQAPGFELGMTLDLLDQAAAERTDGVTSDPYEADVNGYRFIGRNLSWVDADAGTLLQLHLFGSVPRPGVDDADLVHVTGTVGAVSAQHDYAQVRDLIATMTVAPWGHAPGHPASDNGPSHPASGSETTPAASPNEPAHPAAGGAPGDGTGDGTVNGVSRS